MTTLTVDLQLSTEQIAQLQEMAQVRQSDLSDTLQFAIVEWLEQQWQLHQARQKMRAFGQGLASDSAPHDKARNHDAYLYPPKVAS